MCAGGAVDSSPEGPLCTYSLPEGEGGRGWGPGLPSASNKAALSSAETSGEQKQGRMREKGSTMVALWAVGGQLCSLGPSGNIWPAGPFCSGECGRFLHHLPDCARVELLPSCTSSRPNICRSPSPWRSHPRLEEVCSLFWWRWDTERRPDRNRRPVSKPADLVFTLRVYVLFYGGLMTY